MKNVHTMKYEWIVRAFFMKKISKYLLLLTIGGCLYYTFEILFRGFSHWSMFILGGICMVFCTVQGQIIRWKDPMWIQIIRCSIFVMAMEFSTGIILNKWCGLKIWDYSDLPLQLFGQICLPFGIIFSGLCALGIVIGGYLSYWIYHDEKPDLHFL